MEYNLSEENYPNELKECFYMKLSPLQIARYQYQPKLPGMLRNGISEICVNNGAATESVADQEKIQALFPNTYVLFKKINHGEYSK